MRVSPTLRGALARLTSTLVLILLLSVQLGHAQDAAAPLDYTAWEAAALTAEVDVAKAESSDERLKALRAEIVEWRNQLTAAQKTNAERITSLRNQIAALGPPPAEGATEAPEIAQARADLATRLAELEAPGLAAEAAYRRADGLIREIDGRLRDRQTDQLMKLSPSPLNPVHWYDAVLALNETVKRVFNETSRAWESRRSREALYSNLPVILGLLMLSGATTIFGRQWMERLALRLQRRGTDPSRAQAGSFVVSLGQIVLPMIGVSALSQAMVLTGLWGPLTTSIMEMLPLMGLALFVPSWLSTRIFPRHSHDESEEIVSYFGTSFRGEGRFLLKLSGLLISLSILREAAMGPLNYSDAVEAVTSFPLIVAGGLLLWRLGHLLATAKHDDDTESTSFRQKMVGLVAQVIRVVAVLSPALAGFGYIAGADALLYPAILSIWLMGTLIVLQAFLSNIWSLVSDRTGADDSKGLVPVLLGFVLLLASLPIFALIWGARISDMTEMWQKFREGFQLGSTRVSPTDFLIFLLIFMIGYSATRMFQGALRSTILPRTNIEKGGQNALVSGTGYLGIFLAALIAINAAGIDLSGLAILASALSVGIGFGLQNIVQNFVSGIILMIERPVSEGDWIQVGQTQGIVKSISVRSTRIQTFDRNMVIVPNGDLVSQSVTNWTRFSMTGRVIIPIGVAYGTDTRKVEKVLIEIAEAQPLVILNPKPVVVFQTFGPNSMDFELRVVLRDVNAGNSVRTEINHQIAERFAQEGIEIPFAQSDITLRNVDEVARVLQSLQPNPLTANDKAPLSDETT